MMVESTLRAFPVRLHRAHSDAAGFSEQLARCSVCGTTEGIRVTRVVTVPHAVLTKKFASRGWRIGHTRARDVCPACDVRKNGPRRRRSK